MATILIVEDNHANLKLATLLLERAGHAVLAAADAETGLTVARAEQPDLILMDIQLPGMDGLAATAVLKRDSATAAIPVIALTAMAMKADQEKSRLAGCDGYITKPLRYRELYETIDSLLSAERGEGAASVGNDQPHLAERLPIPERGTGSAVDVRALESLVGNDPAVIRELLADFRVSATSIAQELVAACAHGQPARAGEQAHKLKASARAVGALALGDLCEAIESAGLAHNTRALSALLPLFARELDTVKLFIDSSQPGRKVP